MTFEDRRTSGVRNRRLWGRGGRRATDRRAETVTERPCASCGAGARLFAVSTVPGGLVLTYQCDACGRESSVAGSNPVDSALAALHDDGPRREDRSGDAAAQGRDRNKRGGER